MYWTTFLNAFCLVRVFITCQNKTRKKLVATVSRCEDVYNRADEPSVTFCERGGAVTRAIDF